MSTKEASEKWKITVRRIRVLLNKNKIIGSIKVGNNWMMPSDAKKPIDLRFNKHLNFIGLDMDFKEVDTLKDKIESHRPIDKYTSSSLRENLIVNWTYNTNAIEGNTLTLTETKVVLEGIAIGGKSIEEHLEVLNHRKAIMFLDSLLSNKNFLTEKDVKSINEIILNNINDEYAGIYRDSNVIVNGATHIPPKHENINNLMEQMIYNFNNFWIKYHLIIQSALLHGEFIRIHPFIDGNGRTARLLLNLVLMKNGFTPVIIKKENRSLYFDALDYAHTTNDYSLFIKIITESIVESSSLWLSLI